MTQHLPAVGPYCSGFEVETVMNIPAIDARLSVQESQVANIRGRAARVLLVSSAAVGG